MFAADVIFGRYWAGWYDIPREGFFSDPNTGELLEDMPFRPWYIGEPNGHTLENCAMVYVARNAWNDARCTKQYCSFCEFESSPDIEIRGKVLTFRN